MFSSKSFIVSGVTFRSLIHFEFLNLFIYLFLSALCLRCYTRAFSSCGERGLLFVVVHGLLAVEHGLWARGLQ